MQRDLVSLASKPCNRCGSTTVAWHQGHSGKWYLIEVFNDEHGYPVANYRDFHSNYCGNDEHAKYQARLDAEYAEDKAEKDRAASQRETERIQAEAEALFIYGNMKPRERSAFMDELREKLTNLQNDWVSMDYFTEHMRWVQECETLKAEIAMYEDFEGDLA